MFMPFPAKLVTVHSAPCLGGHLFCEFKVPFRILFKCVWLKGEACMDVWSSVSAEVNVEGQV